MSHDRRKFLGALGVGALAAAGAAPLAASERSPRLPSPVSAKYDMSWVERIRGKHRAVFDSPEFSDGGAVFRAAMWRDQLAEMYGIERTDSTPVVVIRHTGIPLAMNSAFWERFEIGKSLDAKDSKKKWVTENPVEKAAPNARGPWAEYNITSLVASGGIVLACDLAFGQMVSKVRNEDKKVKRTSKEAREIALGFLIPGVILQPSGFFGVLRAQEEGCGFIVGS